MVHKMFSQLCKRLGTRNEMRLDAKGNSGRLFGLNDGSPRGCAAEVQIIKVFGESSANLHKAPRSISMHRSVMSRSTVGFEVIRCLKRSSSELQTVANSIGPSVEHAVVHQESFGSLNGTANSIEWHWTASYSICNLPDSGSYLFYSHVMYTFFWQARCIWWIFVFEFLQHPGLLPQILRFLPSQPLLSRRHIFRDLLWRIPGQNKTTNESNASLPYVDASEVVLQQGDDVVTVVAVAPAAERCVWTVSDSEARFWTVLNDFECTKSHLLTA